MARPTIFNEEILTNTQSYIESCVDDLKEKIVKIPTIEGLAYYLKINRDTVYAWCKDNPVFSDMIDDIRSMQADRVLNNGLAGTYNSTIAKLLLVKHGYRDAVDSDVTSGGEKIEGVVILPSKNETKTESTLGTTTETNSSTASN